MSNTDPKHSAEFSSKKAIQSLGWLELEREIHFSAWLSSLQSQFNLQLHTIRGASADASFRRYFRIEAVHASFIVMDAPPDKENCSSFVQISQLLLNAGLKAPRVLQWQQELGFMLLDDLGSQTMLQYLNTNPSIEPLSLFDKSTDALIKWQAASIPLVLPDYDQTLLLRELLIFEEWYVNSYKNIILNAKDKTDLHNIFNLLIRHNLDSQMVYVHRDFMPRNLMVSENDVDKRIGILDFQDAVYGPITYDIASLLRDAFISWDEPFVLDVTIRYWHKAKSAGLLRYLDWDSDFGAFYKSVEWMGLQRHLKVAGIFARLGLRDQKPLYLADTPRFISYIRATAGRYNELKPLLKLIDLIEGYSPTVSYSIGRNG